MTRMFNLLKDRMVYRGHYYDKSREFWSKKGADIWKEKTEEFGEEKVVIVSFSVGGKKHYAGYSRDTGFVYKGKE